MTTRREAPTGKEDASGRAETEPRPNDSRRDVFEEELQSRGIRLPSRGGAWIWLVASIAVGLALIAYRLVDQKGVSVLGRGHVVVLPDGAGTWVFLSDGSVIEAVPESATFLGLATGACARFRGWVREKQLVVEEAECVPGSLLRPVMERMRELRLQPEYWADTLPAESATPEPHLATLELYASLVDRRFDDPQIVPLYRELFPGRLARLREEGRTGKPTVFHVKRNDFVGRRLLRTELAHFLGEDGPVARHGFHLAGAAAEGGWLVRDVSYDPQGKGPVERLLVAPVEAPWPELLASPNLRVRPPKS